MYILYKISSKVHWSAAKKRKPTAFYHAFLASIKMIPTLANFLSASKKIFNFFLHSFFHLLLLLLFSFVLTQYLAQKRVFYLLYQNCLVRYSLSFIFLEYHHADSLLLILFFFIHLSRAQKSNAIKSDFF